MESRYIKVITAIRYIKVMAAIDTRSQHLHVQKRHVHLFILYNYLPQKQGIRFLQKYITNNYRFQNT
uniref:Uncharacterized protein n=1 Tax=Arundo donax TaxID=35708 RepID=A0A0A9EQK3_ARUDO